MGNRFTNRIGSIWHRIHLFAKIVAAVFVLFILAQIIEAISFHINDVSGGLDTASGDIFGWSFLASLGLFNLLIILVPICLIVSIIKKYKSINISLTVTLALAALISQISKFNILQTNEPLRYCVHNSTAGKALKEFGLELNNAKNDKDLIFTRNWGELIFKNKTYLFKSGDFALNENLLNKKLSQIPDNVVVIFESDIPRDVDKIGGLDDISTGWHITQGSLIVFGDGRVEFVKTKDFNNLLWPP
jgi:hypothetical protein